MEMTFHLSLFVKREEIKRITVRKKSPFVVIFLAPFAGAVLIE
jgi:hypothetical protein